MREAVGNYFYSCRKKFFALPMQKFPEFYLFLQSDDNIKFPRTKF